jgi:hypothetical protein
LESTRSCIPEKCQRCSRGSFCRNTLPNSRLSVEVEPERRFHRPLHLTLRRFGSEFSDDPLILHRLTPKLATKNGQVGPPFGPQDIPIGGGLPIHPDLFARTDFRLFCLRYDLLSRTQIPPFAVQSSASLQQNSRLPRERFAQTVDRTDEESLRF